MKILKIILLIILSNFLIYSEEEIVFEGNNYKYSVVNIGVARIGATKLVSPGYLQLIDKREDKITFQLVGVDKFIYISNINPQIIKQLKMGEIYSPKQEIINKIDFFNKFEILKDQIYISESNIINGEVKLSDPDKHTPSNNKFMFKIYENSNNEKKLVLDLEYNPVNLLDIKTVKNNNPSFIGIWENIKNKKEFIIIKNIENKLNINYINLLNQSLNFEGKINNDVQNILTVKSNITPYGKNKNWKYDIILGENLNLGYYLTLNKVPFLPIQIEDFYSLSNEKDKLPNEIKSKL